MTRNLQGLAAGCLLSLALFAAQAAFAQKQGGILRMYDPDSPASMSIHEEATIVSERPMMGVFNNLVMYDQHVPQNSMQSIEADREQRKQLVWEIERKLAEDDARPIIFYDRRATCWQPRVKGLTIMVNSISNGARMEDVWLDK